MKHIKDTFSLCDKCLSRIPAKVIEKNKKILIRKRCEKHGDSESDHIWSNPQDYAFFQRLKDHPGQPSVAVFDATSRCNLYCPVCFAKAGDKKAKDMTYKEIKEINLDSFSTIQITGGEPTLLKKLPEIIHYLKKKGKRVLLLSNGIRLTEKDYIRQLKDAGLDLVVLQLDTIDKKTSIELRGDDWTEKKLSAISNLKNNGIAIGLYCVLMPKSYEKSLSDLMKLTDDTSNIKFIYFTTQTEMGRFKKDKKLTHDKIFFDIEKKYDIKKKDFYLTTELLFKITRIFKKKYFSKCALVNMYIKNHSKLIPINKIFNIKRINSHLACIEKSRFKHIKGLYHLGIILVQEFFLNIFNKNYRILLKELLKRFYLAKKGKRDLVNPFTTIYVGTHQGVFNMDLGFEKNCYKRVYSADKKSFNDACCSYYGKKSIK